MFAKMMNGELVDLTNMGSENTTEYIFNLLKNDTDIIFKEQIKLIDMNILVDTIDTFHPNYIFDIITTNKNEFDIYKQLTNDLQYLADRKLLILSSSYKYYELYYNNIIISSVWNPVIISRDIKDYIKKELLPDQPTNDNYLLCNYWINIKNNYYPISTIFHIDDLD